MTHTLDDAGDVSQPLLPNSQDIPDVEDESHISTGGRSDGYQRISSVAPPVESQQPLHSPADVSDSGDKESRSSAAFTAHEVLFSADLDGPPPPPSVFVIPPRNQPTLPRSLSLPNALRSSVTAVWFIAQASAAMYRQDELDRDDFGMLAGDAPEGSVALPGGEGSTNRHRHPALRMFDPSAWKRHFRPMVQAVYYKALLHLLLLDFLYAITAWAFLACGVLTSASLVVVLPLGVVASFTTLIGARALARGELKLQTLHHQPLAYQVPLPPLPIFTHTRPPTESEIESGWAGTPIPERSFFKNTVTLFKDQATYRALFYFLVIKPSVVLVLSTALWVLVPIGVSLVFPAPYVFKAVRKVGMWQANLAVEALHPEAKLLA